MHLNFNERVLNVINDVERENLLVINEVKGYFEGRIKGLNGRDLFTTILNCEVNINKGFAFFCDFN